MCRFYFQICIACRQKVDLTCFINTVSLTISKKICKTFILISFFNYVTCLILIFKYLALQQRFLFSNRIISWAIAPHTGKVAYFSGTFCPLPFPIRNARFLIGGQPLFSGMRMAVECVRGYMIKPGRFSAMITCGRDGNWQPDPYSIVCRGKTVRTCRQLNFDSVNIRQVSPLMLENATVVNS